MIHNSFELVHRLLTAKEIPQTLKESIIKVYGQKIKDDSELIRTMDKNLKQIITKIENLENGKGVEGKKVEDKTIEKIRQHKPKDVANFMYLFNNPNGLKYLTHDFDQQKDFDIELFLENTKKIFEKETKKLKIPTYLYSIINEFSFSENPNWGNGMNEGFSCSKWKNWSKEYKLSPFRNPEFINTINEFRKLTRIEAPDLKKDVEEIIENVFSDSKIEYSLKRLENADFYTNTKEFKLALKSIFEIIRDKGKKLPNNKFDVTFKGRLVGNYYEIKLIITHYNSFPSKDFNQLLPEWKTEKGTIGNISKKLFGYCDWSIESKFENGSFRINLLKDNNEPEFEKLANENSIGTIHTLTFYYKTSD
jgi:hypothetical protein